MSLLKIKNLQAKIDDKIIINNFNLNINKGEIHIIMGPNGVGKSTITNILAGSEEYNIEGKISFLNQNIFDLSIEERAHLGLFIAFQYPISIPGLSTTDFLKLSYNAIRKAKNESIVDSFDFQNILKQAVELINYPTNLLTRSFNEDFSGGEKKRTELLQMILLKPQLTILDETDSGLDIDSYKNIIKAINHLKNEERSFILITHYNRLVESFPNANIHILKNGGIIKSGGAELAHQIEKEGYQNI